MRKLLKKRLYRYIFAFVALVLLLLSLGFRPFMTDIMGERILVKVEAYDPRDVFRGDYISVNYEISEIELDKLDNNIQENYVNYKNDYTYVDLYNKQLYVSLVRNGSYYEVEKVSLSKPDSGLYLMADYRYFMGEVKTEDGIDNEEPRIIVDYALDRFYVAENTGLELEEAIRNGEAFAIIKVYKGYPLLKEVVTG